MAQLWGGRFTKETDKLVYNFNASISFDKRFYEQDIQGSKAHVMMLAKQGILTDDEKQQILDGTFHVFEGPVYDQNGNEVIASGVVPTFEEINNFNFLVQGVNGSLN